MSKYRARGSGKGYRQAPSKPSRYKKRSLPDDGLHTFKSDEIKVILYLSEPTDGRSIPQFCVDEDMTPITFNRIASRARVAKKVNDRLATRTKNTKALILKRLLASAVQKGNHAAAKLYLEVCGEFVPTTKQKIQDERARHYNQLSDAEIEEEIKLLQDELADATLAHQRKEVSDDMPN